MNTLLTCTDCLTLNDEDNNNCNNCGGEYLAYKNELDTIGIIKDEFNAMLNGGTIPVIEYNLTNDDFIAVDINIIDNYMVFEFNNEHTTCFDGNIIGDDEGFNFKINLMYFYSLNEVLEFIDNNIKEGYIIPNGLELAD